MWEGLEDSKYVDRKGQVWNNIYVRSVIVDVHINNCENRTGLLKRLLRLRNGAAKNNVEAYLRLFNYHRRLSKLCLGQEFYRSSSANGEVLVFENGS